MMIGLNQKRKQISHSLIVWATRQVHRSWWLIPLQPVLVLAMLAAGITTVWPGTHWTTFHEHLGVLAAHGWMALSVAAPIMTLLSYWMILRGKGKIRFNGFWIRLGGDTGQFMALSVFTLMHQSDTANEEDWYVTAVFIGLLVAALIIILRDVIEIVFTEHLSINIHRGRDGPT